MTQVIQFVTLFPEMFSAMAEHSIVKRAQDRGLVDIRTVGLREFGIGVHRQTDDYPFGGGVGMLLRADVVVPAVEWAMMHHGRPAVVIFTSAQGERFTQAIAAELAQAEHVILVAGHYEGIDERAGDILGARELSVGDFIVTGGELPAMLIADAVIRLLPGVLGAEQSAEDDSFSGEAGWLEGPQYTRPVVYRGREVPDVLLSGHHERIRQWRRQTAWERTRNRRPDLLG